MRSVAYMTNRADSQQNTSWRLQLYCLRGQHSGKDKKNLFLRPIIMWQNFHLARSSCLRQSKSYDYSIQKIIKSQLIRTRFVTYTSVNSSSSHPPPGISGALFPNCLSLPLYPGAFFTSQHCHFFQMISSKDDKWDGTTAERTVTGEMGASYLRLSLDWINFD